MKIPYAILAACVLVYLIGKAIQVYVQHRKRLRVNLESVPGGPEDPDVRNPELPGRARVVQRATPIVTEAAPEPEPRSNRVPGLRMTQPERVEPVFEPAAEHAVVEQAAVAEDLAYPHIFAEHARSTEVPLVTEPVFTPAAASMMVEEADVPVLLEPAARLAEAPLVAEHAVMAEEPVSKGEQQDMFAGEPVVAPARREPSLAERASALYETQALEPVNTVARAEVQDKVHEQVQDVIAIHVICRGVPFNGEDLLRCILSYGLRFGEMSIFHRHEQPTGQGRVLFSMAKAVEPGTFDLETMTSEMIPGVSFFQSLPGVNSLHAYDIMIDTAKRLAHELNGDMLDLQQSPMTRQLIEHYRERVSEFERRRLMARK